jgi:hypothetical protein
MNSFVALISGAVLAILGGYVGDEIRTWRERSRERKAIKICIVDELREIETTIGNMHQVWDTAATFHPSYVSDLIGNTSAYDTHRPRMFLIKDTELRKEIGDFYKKLKDTAKKTEGKLGTLAQTEEARNEQRGFDTAFQAIGTESRALRGKLEK